MPMEQGGDSRSGVLQTESEENHRQSEAANSRQSQDADTESATPNTTDLSHRKTAALVLPDLD